MKMTEKRKKLPKGYAYSSQILDTDPRTGEPWTEDAAVSYADEYITSKVAELYKRAQTLK